jgi:hypothetical protein
MVYILLAYKIHKKLIIFYSNSHVPRSPNIGAWTLRIILERKKVNNSTVYDEYSIEIKCSCVYLFIKK